MNLGFPQDYMLISFWVVPVSALMLLSFAMNDFPALERGKANRCLAYASNISYAFFLAQFFTWPPIKVLTRKQGNNNNAIKIVSSFLLCIMISVFFHEVIEKRGAAYIRKITGISK